MTVMTIAPASYTTRVLPPAEWPRLVGTEAEALWPHLNPDKATVIVVERDGEIVGCWTLLTVLHAECVWVAPAHRGRPSVPKRLLGMMQQLVRDRGFDRFWTAAATDDVRALVDHLRATQVPGDHYIVAIQGERSCR